MFFIDYSLNSEFVVDFFNKLEMFTLGCAELLATCIATCLPGFAIDINFPIYWLSSWDWDAFRQYISLTGLTMRLLLNSNLNPTELLAVRSHISSMSSKLYRQTVLIKEYERLSSISVADRSISDKIRL